MKSKQFEYACSYVDIFNDWIGEKTSEFEVQIGTICGKDGRYVIDVLEIKDGVTKGIIPFASEIPDDEVMFKAHEACQYVKDMVEFKKNHPDEISFKFVGYSSHDIAALIWSFTEFPLYYIYQNGKIEKVDDNEAGIDAYGCGDGGFYVRFEDYAPALSLVECHDEFGANR